MATMKLRTMGWKHTCRAMALLLAGGSAQGLAASRYDGDGALDPQLEVQRWLINRGRHRPEQMADELGLVHPGHSDYDVCEDGQGNNDFGAGPAEWADWTEPRGPLAPNEQLNTACRKHSQDMAETDVFSHNSPSASFYPIGSEPWQRQLAEGYDNEVAGYYENIAYRGQGYSGGYPDHGGTGAEFVQDLFVDEGIENRGHRKAILNRDAREIGLGWHRIQSFDGVYYWTTDYTTQDFGRRPDRHFFTGTLFQDADGDERYEEGEGVSGIEVRLFHGATEAAWYDRSGTSGEFSIPMDDLPDGAQITLVLKNPGPTSRVLSIPLGYDTLGAHTLEPGQALAMGRFTQPAGADNVGFRQIQPLIDCTLTAGPDGVHIAFNALLGVSYQVEALDVGGDWTVIDSIVADQPVEVSTDPAIRGARTYRVSMTID